MKTSWIFFTILLICSFTFLGWRSSSIAAPGHNGASPESGSSHRLAASLQVKLDHIERNGAKERPDQTPTVMSEEEINDYLASGRVQLPEGVKKVRLQGQSGKVDAFLTVDFDKIRASHQSSNPLLGLFSGTHDVTVESDAFGRGGQGKVHVKTVSIDGMEVPHIALEYFVDKYVTSKYPNLGLDSHFQMPDKVDTATVGYHKLVVTQK